MKDTCSCMHDWINTIVRHVCNLESLKLPVRCMTFHAKSHNMKALVILSHSWSPFLPLTFWYWKNELLCVSVRSSGVFSWEKTPTRFPMQITWQWPPVDRFCHGLVAVRQKNVNITLLDFCLFTQYMPVSQLGIEYKQTWYPPDVKLLLSNIINHGVSDVQWQISIYGSNLSVFVELIYDSFKWTLKGRRENVVGVNIYIQLRIRCLLFQQINLNVFH